MDGAGFDRLRRIGQLVAMCNLYRLRARPDHLRELLQYVEDHEFAPRSYISPGSPIAIVRAERGARHLALVRWGFVPSWAKEVAPGRPLTNARIETLLEKASFKNAVRRRRCLIPADGYYEWSGVRRERKQAGLPGDPRRWSSLCLRRALGALAGSRRQRDRDGRDRHDRCWAGGGRGPSAHAGGRCPAPPPRLARQ